MSASRKTRLRWWLRRLIARKWFDIGLQAKMSALVTVGLAGLISIFAFVAVSNLRQSAQQLLGENVLRARILAENLDSNLGQVAGLLTILASELDAAQPHSSIQNWENILREDFRSVQGLYLLDEHAHLLASTEDPLKLDWSLVPALREPWQEAPRRISFQGLPRPYALVAVPVHSTGGSPASLAALLDLSNPDIYLAGESLGLRQHGVLQILDEKGEVLASTHPSRSLTPDTTRKIISLLFVEGQPRVEACLGCEGDKLDETGTIIAFAPLAQVPWGVVIWHDSQQLFAPVRQLATQTLVLAFITAAGAILLVILTTRSVINPVQALTEATRRIGETQFDPDTLQAVESTLAASRAGRYVRRDEIGLLSNSFIAMCRRLRLSLEETRALARDLDERVQARTLQLSTVNAVATTVNRSLNLADILQRALDEVLHLTGIDMAAIFLLDPASGRLKLNAFRGLSEHAARLAYQVGLLDGNCGGVLELGRAVVVPDISQLRGRGAQSLQRENVTAMMHVPLMTRDHALGSLCLGTHDNMKFDDQEQRLFTSIGNQIAIAVENARLYAELQHKERLRGELFQKTLAAQEEERKRIARELHDEVSQSLTALLYEAEGGLELKAGAAALSRFQDILALTRRSLDNVHNLIFDLRPSMLDQLGLIPAVRWLAKTRLEPREVRVVVETAEEQGAQPLRLSAHIETALFRVIQEAINNIARHAAARNVEIRLEWLDGAASISIRDDGVGFDLNELAGITSREIDSGRSLLQGARGLGLVGMQERIELLGGEMEINTAPGAGTWLKILIPLQERSFAS